MSQLRQIAKQDAKPKYPVTIPSTETKTKMSPFLVKDEKVLLMAAESKDTKQMMSALKQVVARSVDGVDVDRLAPYDLEYLFLKLREISVGETTDVVIRCSSCETENKQKINLTELKVIKDEKHESKIKISENMMFIMKYPDLEKVEINEADPDSAINMFVESVDTVVYGEDMIKITPAEKADLLEIIENLTTKQFNHLKDFFETMPKLNLDVSFKCGSCGADNDVVLSGLADFF